MEPTPNSPEPAVPAAEPTPSEPTVINNGDPTPTETTYANGKYTSVSDLENGYTELQKSYSQKLGGFDGAPENYTLDEGIESTPRLEALQTWGKENQLSNEALNDIIKMDAETTQKAQEAYITEQKEALGKDADTRLTNISDWARAQVGEDGMDTFNAMITSSKGVELMESLMKNSQDRSPTPTPSNKTVNKEEINAMRFAIDKNSGQRRMSIDPAYRAKVEAMEAELHERG